jgi:hypothetical protein
LLLILLMAEFLCSSKEPRATNISQKRQLEEDNITDPPYDSCTAAKTCPDCKGIFLSDLETPTCAFQIGPAGDTMVCIKVNKAESMNQEGAMCSQDSTITNDFNDDNFPSRNYPPPGAVLHQEDYYSSDDAKRNGGAIIGLLFLLLLGGVVFKIQKALIGGPPKGGDGSNKAAAKYHEMSIWTA